jgi:tRNA-2-methylthio-N6-dimethylallyladenosine synthase
MELQIKTKTKSCAGYYYIETFGCQMNEFDSERLSFILENLNYLKTGRAEDADLIVIKTDYLAISAILRL